MSDTHNTWPVLLIPCNLPLWICMKQPSIILSIITLGERPLSMDIDVYLQPLMKELLQLWEGVDVFNACTMTHFKSQRALHSTTNYFPTYANLSRWSTKGHFACQLVLKVHIQCGWKMDINFVTWVIKDGCP